jgi:hypothetical protein
MNQILGVTTKDCDNRGQAGKRSVQPKRIDGGDGSDRCRRRVDLLLLLACAQKGHIQESLFLLFFVVILLV